MDRGEMELRQIDMSESIIHDDQVKTNSLRLVGGLDIQWVDDNTGFAVLSVFSWPELSLVHTRNSQVYTQIPYQSGFLGFRECPCYRQLLQTVTPFEPHICLVNGFGTLHPRGCGSASHLGVQTGMPTVGVGKTLLKHSCTMSETEVKDHLWHTTQVMAELHNAAGRVVGCAVKRNLQARQPVYVSVGHKVSLGRACNIVYRCCLHRIPEPIRQADMLARALARAEST